MVPKKNLFTLLDAYALYIGSAAQPRPLVFCGSGPLEAELQQKVLGLGLSDKVTFRGLLPSAQVSQALATSIALLLLSTEEQFGLVVPEALAMGVPVIISQNCGARDELVRTGVNGFLVEPDNVPGIAYLMRLISDNEAVWLELSRRRRRRRRSEETWRNS